MRKLPFCLVLLAGCGGGGNAEPDAGDDPLVDAASAPDAADDSPDASGPCAPRSASSDDPRLAAALDVLEAYMAEKNIPGGALAVVTGSTTYMGTVGVKTTGGCEPIGYDTRFRIGLLAEIATSAAVLSGEEEGLLDTAGPATDHADFSLTAPADASQVTLTHLLTERSGIGPGPGGCPGLAAYFASNALPAWSPPGRVGRWNPGSFALAGLAVASLGDSFAAEMQDRVFAPLGMSGATYSSTVTEAGDHADGHFPEAAGLRVQHADALGDCELREPSDQLFASITDAARLAHMMVNDGDGVIGVASIGRMLIGTVASSLHSAGLEGLGFVNSYSFQEGVTLAWQGGVSAGYGQDLSVSPERDIAIVVLANQQDYTLWMVSRAALQAFQSDLTFDYSYTPDSSGWGEYVGTWVDPIGFGAGPRTMEIAFDGTTLSATLDGTSYDLAPADGDDMFTANLETAPANLRFWRNGADLPDILSGSGPPFFRQ